MVKKMFTCVIGILLAVTCFSQPVWGGGELAISCEGTLCNGGGIIRYQYTLMNTGVSPETLTAFYLGTDDLNAGNYTNWVAPFGFTATAQVADWTTLYNQHGCAVMYTSGAQTPHRVVPPPGGPATAGGIYWSGSFPVYPGSTATFGFHHPNDYQDVEWFSVHPIGVEFSMGYSNQPIAGPKGTYTNGYIHGPSSEPVTDIPTLTEWGLIIFGVVLLGFITYVFLRRRKVIGVRA